MSEKEIIRDRILKEASKGNVVLNTIEGLCVTNLAEIIKQPAEGLLYDLNRDRVTVAQNLDDPKWINDFAVALVIERLKAIIERAKPVLDAAKNLTTKVEYPESWYPEAQTLFDAVHDYEEMESEKK
jgi:hypothetical protein